MKQIGMCVSVRVCCRGGGSGGSRMEENKAIMELYKATAELKVRGCTAVLLYCHCGRRWDSGMQRVPRALAVCQGQSIRGCLPGAVYQPQASAQLAWPTTLPPCLQAKAVQEYVQLLLDSGQKFLVFGHHTSLLDAIEHTCNRHKGCQ